MKKKKYIPAQREEKSHPDSHAEVICRINIIPSAEKPRRQNTFYKVFKLSIFLT